MAFPQHSKLTCLIFFIVNNKTRTVSFCFVVFIVVFFLSKWRLNLLSASDQTRGQWPSVTGRFNTQRVGNLLVVIKMAFTFKVRTCHGITSVAY